jgi:hypothetical protein
LISIKVGRSARADMEAITFGGFSMTVLIVAVVTIFGAFAAAMAYAEFQTRGIFAPGAKKPD